MKDKIFSYTKDRSFITNLLFCIFSLVGIIILPSILSIPLSKVVHNERLCIVIADFIFIAMLVLIYYKDLKSEAKIYFSDFKNKFKYSFKIYILGYMGMVFFNLIVMILLKNISSNESQVREMLYNNVLLSMISISIIAPISEEIIFRKSIRPLINNRWVYVVVCGLLFGGAHILTNVLSGEFVISDLIYVLPYACLGGSFALMDYNTKTTFSSIVIHSLHNTITGIMLLITYFGGK